jgi:hypothetical protein
MLIGSLRVLHFQHSAVNADYFTGNIPGFLGAQEANKRSHVRSGAEPSGRNLGQLAVPALLDHCVCHIGMNNARGVGIYGNPVGSELGGADAGKHVHTGLCKAIGDQTDVCKFPGN